MILNKLRKKSKSLSSGKTALSVSCAGVNGWHETAPLSGIRERALYRELRLNVPIIDAAIYKLRRLIGGFTISCEDKEGEKPLNAFLRDVPVGACGRGIDEFIGTYFEDLLTYGNAVGEMVAAGESLRALYNASLNNLELSAEDPMKLTVCAVGSDGKRRPCPYPELILCSALNPPSGSPYGESILRGLPFISEVLLKIYRTVGINWDRLGNVRFSVTCKPDENGGVPASERVKQMAAEWKRAMRSSEVSDFVAVGDVSIKAIGADGQILNSDVPVRQMLEQIVAKLGLPPFLLGLSWSSTERMSSQQADVLTSELEAYRRLLNPVILKIARTWLILEGFEPECSVLWDDITMQDEVDHASARLSLARARQIEQNLKEDE